MVDRGRISFGTKGTVTSQAETRWSPHCDDACRSVCWSSWLAISVDVGAVDADSGVYWPVMMITVRSSVYPVACQ
jgi:hypothetical protein